jgi:hypothetical protein
MEKKLQLHMEDVVDFIHKHPEKALLTLHFHHKRKKGGQEGGSWKSFWHGVKKIGKKAVSTAYKGAEKFYDYTGGLPAKALETVSKKIFKVNLNDYKTYRDAKAYYQWSTGDPRKYKEMYNAMTHPTETYEHVKKYIKPAIMGLVKGPAGAVAGIAQQRIREDLAQDFKKIKEKRAKKKKKGEGLKIPPLAKKFLKNHPKIAEKIRELVKKHKGSGMSKKTKKDILKAVGAVGLVGAMGFVSYLMNKDTVSIPQLDHTMPDDEWATMEGFGVSGAGWGDIKKFIKDNRKKALAVLLGVSVVGLTLAGRAFMEKYGGIAPTSSDGRAIIKHLLSGSKKKLEVGDLIFHGEKLIKSGSGVHLSGHGLSVPGGGLSVPGGGKMSKKVKTALKVAGALAIPSAVVFAKWVASSRGSVVDDDFGSISAEEHLEMFGDGLKPPYIVKSFAKKYPEKAKVIIRELGKTKLKIVKKEELKNLIGKTRRRKLGTKDEVFKGFADRTSGGLYKCDLCLNKRGKVVSIKQMKNGKLRIKNLKRLK